jgi:hypothetical protein
VNLLACMGIHLVFNVDLLKLYEASLLHNDDEESHSDRWRVICRSCHIYGLRGNPKTLLIRVERILDPC